MVAGVMTAATAAGTHAMRGVGPSGVTVRATVTETIAMNVRVVTDPRATRIVMIAAHGTTGTIAVVVTMAPTVVGTITVHGNRAGDTMTRKRVPRVSETPAFCIVMTSPGQANTVGGFQIAQYRFAI